MNNNGSEAQIPSTRRATKTDPLTKITAKIFAPIYKSFDDQMANCFMSRDAFLDSVIASELPNVSSDLAGLRLSPVAKRYVSGMLKSMGGRKAGQLKQTSIAVRTSTSVALGRVVDKHNLSRDTLINWIIVLLRSTDKLLDALDLPKKVGATRASTADMPTSPLQAIEESQADPFYYLRAACEERHGCGLYALPLPVSLHGFSCFIAEDQVPATAAYEARLAKEEAEASLLLDLEDFESALAGKRKTFKRARGGGRA